ncbi:class I SAM-dependent RNA methyltransferase [Gordonia sp. PDNC005]|uniref:class I SAM-dependent RNA methyltransferase n=1 Tax=unclassified Gordonia (in: high G+C Gram-positive bacteria) TaxID=2657482 RepID=UPI001966447C|nr:TRAM domain-containing protein [Gordonia sp. PDNC005]QRY63962.1 class I SAM-dependent RNA methyltransferase [Gordonia sp. PDNC005]
MTELELDVTGYANGGSGIARHNGRVVFVAGALPGERVRVNVTDDSRASYAKASVIDVLDASAHRVDPLCPAAAAGAGCCDLSFVDPAYARELGADALGDVLRRIGGFGEATPPPTVDPLGDDPTGWRVRTRLAVGPDGVVGLRGRRSSDLVTTPCAGPVAGLLDGLDGLGGEVGTELVLASDSHGTRHIAELSAPVDRRGKGGRGKDRRGRAQRSRSAHSAPRSVRTVQGDAHAVQTIGERTWTVPVAGFWQAHRNAPAAYTRAALELITGVGLSGDVHVWDLYGGVGVFSASLLDGAVGLTVRGVDLVDTDPGALAAAERALAADPVEIHRGAVADVVSSLHAPDLVISDPPRSGAGADVVDAIVAAEPGVVVHVGCDAAAFARDLGRFATLGYTVREWRAFDAFPMTHHVEGIAVLTR